MGELQGYALAGVAVLAMVLAVSIFYGDVASNNNFSGDQNFSFAAKTAALTAELNGTVSSISSKTQSLQAQDSGLLGLGWTLVTGALEILKLPFAVFGLLQSVFGDMAVLLGIDSIFVGLGAMALVLVVAFAVLSAVHKWNT